MKNIIRRVIAAGVILAALTVTANTTNWTTHKAAKEHAHEIAESIRAAGYPEDHPVIIACQQWWREEDNAEKSQIGTIYVSTAQRSEYPEASYVWQLLKEAGLSDIHAAAILGNAMAESGGHTLAISVYQDVSGYWGAWAMSKVYYADVVGQGADAQVAKILETVGAGFYQTTDVRSAARWFSDNWERPARWSEKRADNAEAALAYFGS